MGARASAGAAHGGRSVTFNVVGKLSVGFSKMVSDNSFGNERAEVVIEYDELSDEAEAMMVADRLAHECRRLVHAQLERSPSVNIRNALGRETKRLTIPEPVDQEPF